VRSSPRWLATLALVCAAPTSSLAADAVRVPPLTTVEGLATVGAENAEGPEAIARTDPPQGAGARNGRVIYRAGANRFGGVMQMLLSGGGGS
jgi:hypothetical protein